MIQTQKLQNNFFFQPSSTRDSAEVIQITDSGQRQEPKATVASIPYQPPRNARTAASGNRQRILSQRNKANPQMVPQQR
jgi:hypothetical protein